MISWTMGAPRVTVGDSTSSCRTLEPLLYLRVLGGAKKKKKKEGGMRIDL